MITVTDDREWDWQRVRQFLADLPLLILLHILSRIIEKGSRR